MKRELNFDEVRLKVYDTREEMGKGRQQRQRSVCGGC